MQKKVLLLHGWGGSDFPHWQSWLAGELAKGYATISFLKFSNPDFPELGMWKKELKEHLQDFKPDIVICHSLANTLWFHLCNEESFEDIKKLYLVAPPKLNSEIEELKSFFPVQAPEVPHAKEILLIVSTNDPYMTLQEAKDLQCSLKVEMKVLNNAGHINATSGYGAWPWMLEELRKDLQNG
ncbi:alpha/beta hydrolase [bacterium]|nr:alpha/beta hydrolase [bacterium]MBU1994911.1 alpha/beta hydrolase [bacterium]